MPNPAREASNPLKKTSRETGVSDTPAKFEGSPQPKARSQNTYAAASNRHLDDISRAREQFRELYNEKATEFQTLMEQVRTLEAEKATLAERNRKLTEDLQTERLNNGLGGIVGTILIALSSLQDWKWGWQSFTVLSGCLLIFWNSVMIGVQEIRRRVSITNHNTSI